jgi:hypothetical protein
MEIKILGIGTNCVSLFTKENDEFIGYVGVNMFYFDTEILKWYKLHESELLDEFIPKVRNGEIKLNDIKFIKIKRKILP